MKQFKRLKVSESLRKFGKKNAEITESTTVLDFCCLYQVDC